MKSYLSIITTLLLFACSENEKTDNTNAPVTEKAPAKKRSPTDIHLIARPDSLSFESANTTVIVVDMQNDFGSKGGMFDRAGIDISMIQKAIVPTANVIAAARKRGIEIIYLKM